MLFLNTAYATAFLFGLRISTPFNGLSISIPFPIEARPVLELQVCSYHFKETQTFKAYKTESFKYCFIIAVRKLESMCNGFAWL